MAFKTMPFVTFICFLLISAQLSWSLYVGIRPGLGHNGKEYELNRDFRQLIKLQEGEGADLNEPLPACPVNTAIPGHAAEEAVLLREIYICRTSSGSQMVREKTRIRSENGEFDADDYMTLYERLYEDQTNALRIEFAVIVQTMMLSILSLIPFPSG